MPISGVHVGSRSERFERNRSEQGEQEQARETRHPAALPPCWYPAQQVSPPCARIGHAVGPPARLPPCLCVAPPASAPTCRSPSECRRRCSPSSDRRPLQCACPSAPSSCPCGGASSCPSCSPPAWAGGGEAAGRVMSRGQGGGGCVGRGGGTRAARGGGGHRAGAVEEGGERARRQWAERAPTVSARMPRNVDRQADDGLGRTRPSVYQSSAARVAARRSTVEFGSGALHLVCTPFAPSSSWPPPWPHAPRSGAPSA